MIESSVINYKIQTDDILNRNTRITIISNNIHGKIKFFDKGIYTNSKCNT
jgi:hypothetical protein